MQCVIYPGDDVIFAWHDDGQELAGRYRPRPPSPDAPAVVPVPDDFVFATNENGQRLDPRRFAGEGSSPVGATKS